MTTDRHQHALDPGDMLHWYEIQSILGHGGFGITYIARDTNLDYEVAIKEYLPREFSTRTASGDVEPLTEKLVEIFEWGKARFLEEARTLFQFKHDNIVRVLSFFEANNTGYMVMEYERGVDFSALIQSGQALSEDELLMIILPILDGLRLVHDEGFIHRDIKPHNIVLRDDGRPVLIDFGSARQAVGAQTRTLTALITPGYTAMEQYHEAIGKQGPWTDIYALGATLYVAITGDKPADALKRSAAISEKKQDAYEPLTALRAGEYSEHFLAAIDLALEFSASKRPQSLDQWSDMLQGIAPVPVADPAESVHLGPAIPNPGRHDPPVYSSPTAETLRPPAPRKPGAAKAWLLAGTIVLVLSLFFYWESAQKQLESDTRASTANSQPTQPVAENAAITAVRPGSPDPQEATSPTATRLDNDSDYPTTEIANRTDIAAPRTAAIDLSGRYLSDLTYTRNDSGVDQSWYFGEQPRLKVELQQIGNRIIGLIEGNRQGRLEGQLRDNEIAYVFNLLDPGEGVNQGRGIWFVSADGETLVGKWFLVNPEDGATFLEGDWTLNRID